ncbi:hypothetical protein LTR10_021432 [Elasticomyces elasticus]|uniref:Uncharacterized protein n=1 Tax=Exophiala sideris TaxID=1016849 RepID=A0ABR0JM16_9EURO|nr:hypothetical protein LTR10_021432 [Elasticomyces elasticus]KAK5036632.1 hypothetical protein LTS07_002359 [Exophiala sideris]KAK5041537.1 hypothetical protein LTR13_002204 [Exophiala sideris]KAK5067015.1 hypothetical protein LTR69_002363 [Exophiala sideris]KAK5185074.1 hypothetical protein LTR44_002920 [Eurotiomycetes sp. CCFEE 6388]
MAPPDPQRWTYTDYVCFLRSHGFHNLTCLDDYLRWGVEATHNPSVPRPQKSTTILLEFGMSNFRTSDLTDASKLRVLLKEWTKKTPSTPTTPTASKVQGRIIMVNNASPEMIDTLGGLLNIEPAFFASHIADHGIGSMGEVHTASPLASQNLRHQQQFFTIEYPCAFIAHGCGKDVDIEKLYCKGNYRRRVEVCSKYGKNKVALARRKISFYMKKTLDPWLCVVLVDPPISHFTLGAETTFGAYSPTQRLDVSGFHGGYLDFIEMRPPTSKEGHDFRNCGAKPMCPNAFDDLCRHWAIMARDGLLHPSNPNMINIMRPAFQIAASECTNFFDYIRSTLEFQPITTALALEPPKAKRILDKIISLDSMLSRYKPILTRIKSIVSSDSDLNDDYRSLLIDLHHYRAECDSQMQHILAVSQCHDTASLTSMETETARQADYSRYLVIIVLIYVPFALACAIFSLPNDFAPAAHYMYYLLPATAVVAILLILLVLPESRDPFPGIKDWMCGKLSRKALLAKPKSRNSSSGFNEKNMVEEV